MHYYTRLSAARHTHGTAEPYRPNDRCILDVRLAAGQSQSRARRAAGSMVQRAELSAASLRACPHSSGSSLPLRSGAGGTLRMSIVMPV